MSKKIKISVVGIGLMGLQHIKAIQKSKLASLHSIVEIKKTGIELSKKFNVPLYKNIKILLTLTAGSLVISFGIYFDGKSNNSNNEQEALMPNFDEILSQINSIEFKNSKESTIIKDINNQW